MCVSFLRVLGRIRSLSTLWALGATPLLGCTDAVVGVGDVAKLNFGGRVERIETLGSYTRTDAALLMQLAGAATARVENDYYLYRVVYPSVDVAGEETRVSGLLAIPDRADIKGVVSWQHGTNTYRPESISKPSLPEGLGLAALFASGGYVFIAQDYLGLGVSTAPHPYYYWPNIVRTGTDFLEIAQIIVDGLSRASGENLRAARDLYLAGFSEGGGASVAVQRSLETDNPTALRLRATASISGAFNLRGISIKHAFESDNTLHFAFILAAFAVVYGHSLEAIVQAPFDEKLLQWFDGEHGGAFLQEHLPKKLEDLLTPQFAADFAAGIAEPAWFYAALDATATYDYSPRAPLRLYFGTADNIVIPREAEAAFEHMQTLGGNVELVEVGPYDHENIVAHSVPSIRTWFDELEGATL
jgi:alpha-beta hydrolase superfamily lysophospholipase